MGYGQGDYGQGDYGQGDPGLFSFLGKVIKGAAGIVSHIPGLGLVGDAAKAIAGSGGGSVGMTQTVNPGGPIPMYQSGGFAGGSMPSGRSIDIGYGLFHKGTEGTSIAGGLYESHTGLAPSGYHVIRKGPHAGKLTRNRRMNVTNPRALRRAIRRGHGFEKMARRMLGFATPHKPKGRMYFRKRTGRK